MRFWRRFRGQDDNYGIAVGQRFRSVGPVGFVWEVVTVQRYPGEPVPHVRLHRVGTPNDGKTVALQVLRDRRFYQPAP